jgi:phosphatidylglycerophosphate synthase
MIRKSQLPDLVTGSRLALLPLLWALAAAGMTHTLAIGIAIAASTDMFDGLLARALDARSDLGSRLDSIADHLLSASVLVWLFWLQPEFIAHNGRILLTWAVFGAATLGVGWIRFGRIGDLHLYSAKLAMVLGYVFVIALFYFDSYDPRMFAVALGACFVATGESLLVYLTRDEPGERIGSILLRRQR